MLVELGAIVTVAEFNKRHGMVVGRHGPRAWDDGRSSAVATLTQRRSSS